MCVFACRKQEILSDAVHTLLNFFHFISHWIAIHWMIAITKVYVHNFWCVWDTVQRFYIKFYVNFYYSIFIYIEIPMTFDLKSYVGLNHVNERIPKIIYTICLLRFLNELLFSALYHWVYRTLIEYGWSKRSLTKNYRNWTNFKNKIDSNEIRLLDVFQIWKRKKKGISI